MRRPKLAAQLEDPKTGRVMKVLTTAPGLQLYTGNFIQGVSGKSGCTYNKHAGLCLETQVPAIFSTCCQRLQEAVKLHF